MLFIVPCCHFRLFVLKEQYIAPPTSSSDKPVPVVKKEEWKLVCTGIPCVVTEKRSSKLNSPFIVKVGTNVHSDNY